MRLLDSEGNEIAKFYSESRIPLNYDAISENAVKALVATEDAEFWDHRGVSHRGIIRAAATMLGGGQRQGASTITMQLVQNLRQVKATYDDDRRAYVLAQADTPPLKMQEMKMALEFEKAHSKEDILTAYFNTVYFGNGFYGLGAAAQGYYSVPASELTIGQAAMIVGLAQNPSRFNPVENPDAATDRRNQVLGRLLATGVIDEETHDVLVGEPLGLNVNPRPIGPNGCEVSPYPYYCELAKAELLSHPVLGGSDQERQGRFYAGGFDVRTALSPKVVGALNHAAHTLNAHPYHTGIASITPSTGEITGISQSTQYENVQTIYANSALQTGSAFKPVTIASAIDNNVGIDWNFNVTDGYRSPVFDNPPGGFGNAARTSGTMNIRQAVRTSNNVYFIRLLEKAGVQETASVARRLGLPMPNSLTGSEGSLTLGSYEATPIQVASAYATFANSGVRCEPHTVTAIGDTPIQPKCARAITADAASAVNNLLTEPLLAGGTADMLRFTGDVRGKSGSTDEYAVLWFAAYTPHGAIAAWVADPEGPTANPVRNIDVYGNFEPVGHGGDVAGRVVERAFNGSGIGSAPFTWNNGGDIIQTEDYPVPVGGLSPENALTLLLSKHERVSVVNHDGEGRMAVSYDDGVLTVSGAPELHGNVYVKNATTGVITVNDKSEVG